MRNQSRRRAFFPLAAGLLLLLQACLPGPRSGSGAPDGPGGSREERAVLAAVRAAFALEERLWDQRGRMHSREDVAAWLRQGFCEEEARRLADFLWLEGQEQADPSAPPLRVGEPILLPPDEMSVESLEGEERAVVRLRYEARTGGPTEWPAQNLRLVMLKEADGWKICGFRPEDPPGAGGGKT